MTTNYYDATPACDGNTCDDDGPAEPSLKECPECGCDYEDGRGYHALNCSHCSKCEASDYVQVKS